MVVFVRLLDRIIMKSKYNNILVINKPSGMTSRDVVNRISKALNTKKVGHTGTLDPMAKGVLVITTGKYTKLNEILTSTFKEYLVELVLGYETDTLDVTGKVLKESNNIVDEKRIKAVIESFKGTYKQEVPAYSAVKINGKRLYEYARENKTIELPKREVNIKNISCISISENTVSFKCVVSKGTYIRSLVRDIGVALGTYATMSNLVRTNQGKFSIENAYTIEDIEQGKFTSLKTEDILDDLYTVNIDDKVYKDVSNGVVKEYNIKEDYILFKYLNAEVALYKRKGKSEFGMYVKF